MLRDGKLQRGDQKQCCPPYERHRTQRALRLRRRTDASGACPPARCACAAGAPACSQHTHAAARRRRYAVPPAHAMRTREAAAARGRRLYSNIQLSIQLHPFGSIWIYSLNQREPPEKQRFIDFEIRNARKDGPGGERRGRGRRPRGPSER
eukprot:COSAG02_NODE_1121_length_14453_cov_3.494775_7_plen_151_part_00